MCSTGMDVCAKCKPRTTETTVTVPCCHFCGRSITELRWWSRKNHAACATCRPHGFTEDDEHLFEADHVG